MVNSKDFSKRLEKILDYYGLTATAFSDEIDFNRSTISHLLSGRNKPSLEFVMKVLQKFPEVELYWLLNGKGEFPKQAHQAVEAPARTSNSQEEKSGGSLPTKPAMNPSQLQLDGSDSKKTIERIVVFYTDGTFKAYEN